MTNLRDLMVLEAKRSVTFRGVRMSRAQRRDAATSGAFTASPDRSAIREARRSGRVTQITHGGPARERVVTGLAPQSMDVRGAKPSTARLRKAGVVVPRKANAKRANALAKRRGKLIAAKNKPPRASRSRRAVAM